MKERVSDHEIKKTGERTMIRLFSPLTAIRYSRYDLEDLNGEGEELLPAELCSYQKEILDQIAKERLPEEGDRGLAEYLNDEGLKEKIYSMNPTVEVWRGELWGVLEVECRGELSPKELEDVKEYWEGQESDGWGEGFEQREIKTSDGEVCVSFWNSGSGFFITTEEQLKGQIQEPFLQMGETKEKKFNMTYEAFLELTKKNIKRFLPEPLQEQKVEIHEVLKNNSIRRHGLCVTDSQRNELVPVLYLESYYQKLEQGAEIEDIWQEIAQNYQNYQKEEVTINGTPIREWDYGTIKGSLSVYVRNAEENREFLKTHPHEIQEDLALLYCFDVETKGGVNGTLTIDHDKLKWLGVSEEQLKRDAWVNMKHREPPCFFALDDVMGQFYFGEAMDTEKKGLEHLGDVDPDAMMYVLTNSNQVNGAVYMCDKATMSLIAERLGTDLIVIPSSIHETLILSGMADMSLSALNTMVETVNAEVVDPQERLGNSVYWFDRETQKLEKAVEQVEKLEFEPKMSPVFS